MSEIEQIISRRALNFPENPIRGLEILASEIRNNGIKVISLNIGAPDTPSPREVMDSGIAYLQKNSNVEYGPSSGNVKLIESRSRFYKNRLGLDIEPENILITAGASEALDLAIYSITNPGDEVITPEPFFPNYLATCYKYDTELGVIPTRIEDGFHIQREGETFQDTYARISGLVSQKTKAIIWSSPSNPTGAVYRTDELEVLVKVARNHNLFLIADEVYRLLTFDGGINCGNKLVRAPSIYDIVPQSDRERVLCLDSSSKEISFCGGRIGYLILNQALAPYVLKNASVRACPNILAQKAVEGVDQIDPEYFSENQQELKLRRDLVYSLLSGMEDIGVTVSPKPPEGAFYLTFGLGDEMSAENFCRWMLTDFPRISGINETVFLTPMRTGKGGFYLSETKGKSQIRLAYVKKSSELIKAMDIIRLVIPIYKKLILND